MKANFLRLDLLFRFKKSGLLASLIAVAALCDFLYMLPFIGNVSEHMVFVHKGLTLLFAAFVAAQIGHAGFARNKIYFALWLPIVYLIVYGTSIMQMVECLGLIALWSLKAEQQAQALEKFIAIFCVIILINTLAYPFAALGVLPNFGDIIPEHWLKEASGIYYENLGITFVMHEGTAVDISNISSLYRMSAWFEEPGNVGTFCALMLAATGFRMDAKGKILLAGGMLSFSLAFYIMCMLYNVIKHPKNLIYVIAISASVVWIFQDNEFISTKILDRVSITNGGVSGDNRAEEAFKAAFAQYAETPSIWLGHDADHQLYKLKYNVYSWQNLVWDYGVIGTMMYLSLFLIVFYQRALAVQKARKKVLWQQIAFAAIFFVSIYQRPYVLGLSSALIFIGAMTLAEQGQRQKND